MMDNMNLISPEIQKAREKFSEDADFFQTQGHKYQKRESKLSLFANDMIYFLE